jgi:hypothetical protein
MSTKTVADLRALLAGVPGDFQVLVLDPEEPPYRDLGPMDVPPDLPPKTMVIWATPRNKHGTL